jgi:hypothetical protein
MVAGGARAGRLSACCIYGSSSQQAWRRTWSPACAATPRVTNPVRFEGAAQEPVGDVILCDVAREGASGVLATLREFGVDRTGSVALENVDLSVSEVARAASRAAPGHGSGRISGRSPASAWR